MQKFATIEAVKSALNEMGVKTRLNVISGMPDIHGLDSVNPVEVLLIDVRDHLINAGYKASMKEISELLAVVVDENRYNPVQKMLNSTSWDGRDRINELANDIIGVKTEQEAKYVKRWLHQTVAMAFNGDTDTNVGNDGHDDNGDHDYDLYGAEGVLVLVGRQGNGKTRLFSKLAVSHKWFNEGGLLDFDEDSLFINTSHWITELCYVDNLGSREKAFLTASEDFYRPAYIRDITKKPRRTSFCATLNAMPEQTDSSANRRLWIVDADNLNLDRVQAIDVNWVKQLWKQVYEELYLPNPQGFRSDDKASNSR